MTDAKVSFMADSITPGITSAIEASRADFRATFGGIIGFGWAWSWLLGLVKPLLIIVGGRVCRFIEGQTVGDMIDYIKAMSALVGQPKMTATPPAYTVGQLSGSLWVVKSPSGSDGLSVANFYGGHAEQDARTFARMKNHDASVAA